MRFVGVDIVKHIFALGVIWLHVKSESRYSKDVSDLINIIGNYVDGAVIGFFLISGFFFKGASDCKIQSLVSFFRKTFMRLMIPFFIFSFIYVSALYLLGKYNLDNGLISILKLQGPMQMYFLSYLFFILNALFICTLLLNLFNIDSKYFFLILAVIALICSQVYPVESSAGPNLLNIPLYIFCFSSGQMLKYSFPKNIKSFYFYAFALSSLFLAMSRFDHRFLDVSIVFVLFTLGIYISYSKVLSSFTAPGSGGVYLLHAPITIYVVSLALTKISVFGFLNAVLSVILTYLICLFITLSVRLHLPKLSFLLLE
ncbi:acyltransferase family protein [Thermosynechococcaceae cyanobacterium BACA0444]|uniref:Acyltransferase family protein n=1 Tax=Pseudocalidococcus azoricus BACA0444 TaxID=2918990 RepID=A0AAE4JXL7_9CYAN|nr:acyltransferase family protein [Pseudocalidococcus azoricus]MDS3860084.1 acyltransferase family protein [Pseudocalidococcus azoricus BACA0444]